jgi:hypothetical protein
MVEEIGNHSIWGQTSWISCGIMIQEMQYVPNTQFQDFDIDSICRLAIRYQVQSHRSMLTIEDAQILENKWICLQKLINMFEHQANAFLFNHRLSEDVPMSSLSDYVKYNHADDLDKSGVPGKLDVSHSGGYHEAHHSDGSRTNAEDILILLSSCLGWD